VFSSCYIFGSKIFCICLKVGMFFVLMLAGNVYANSISGNDPNLIDLIKRDRKKFVPASKPEKSLNNHVFLFSHGIADTKKSSDKYSKKYEYGGRTYKNHYYLMEENVRTFDYPDAGSKLSYVLYNHRKSDFAQQSEIEALKRNFETIKDNKVTIVGLSRGASVAINFAAMYQPSNLAALVLISPPDSIKTIIDHQVSKVLLNNLPGVNWVVNFLFGAVFPKYNNNKKASIDLVSRIKKDLPILVICSKEDTLVPASSSIKLYKKLIDSGHENAYLLVVNHGKHSKILSSCRYSRSLTCDVTHAFLKKFKLPHSQDFAKRGQRKLENCQPRF